MRKLLYSLGIIISWGILTPAATQPKQIDQLKTSIRSMHDSVQLNDALNKLAFVYSEINADSCFYYSEKAWNLSQKLHYPKGLADAADNLGNLQDLRGNAQQALRYYNEAFNLYKQGNDLPNMIQASMNIGLIYTEMSKTAKALSSFNNCFALSRNLQQDSIMCFVYANYVSCFFDNLTNDSVKLYMNKSKEIAEKYNDAPMLLFADQTQSSVLISQHKYGQALPLLNQCLQTALSNNFYYSATDILINLGDITSDSAKAFTYYAQSGFIAQQRDFRTAVRFAYEKLYDFYEEHGDDEKSLFYAEKLLFFYNDQKNIDKTTSIDYIDYALKNEALEASLAKTKSQQWLLVCIIIVCLSAIVFTIILWRNAQKLKKTIAALQLQFAQSELAAEHMDHLNKNYARIMKVVAHDLRNPINSITTAGLMLESTNMETEQASELLNMIIHVSRQCYDLIDQLLHTDIEEDLVINPTQTNVIGIVSQCVFLMELKAKEKNQHIEFLDRHAQIIALCDQDKLMRVINNVLANAIKFSLENSKITVSASIKNHNIVIAIADKGIGIPYQLQGKIFDPFTSAKRKGTNGEPAFGLGLYISKRIMEAHGGTIWLESNAENGTTFYIQFPESHHTDTNINVLEADAGMR